MLHRSRTIAIILGCAAAAALSGCYVQSIQPYYTDATVVFDSTLVGTWVSDEDDQYVFTLSDTTHGTYTLTSEQGDAPARFQAVLVELGGADFLDIYPEAPQTENTIYVDHLLRMHDLLKLKMDADTLFVSGFDAEWLQNAIDKKRIRISNVPLDGAILLTGPTSELQTFVAKYAKTPAAFSQPAKFIRSR
jgi:hypothetical protein